MYTKAFINYSYYNSTTISFNNEIKLFIEAADLG